MTRKENPANKEYDFPGSSSDVLPRQTIFPQIHNMRHVYPAWQGVLL